MTTLSVWNPFSLDLDDFFYSETKSKYLSKDKDGNLFLELDMPGVKKEDLSISIKEGILEIKGERKIGSKTTFQKRYSLSKNVDIEKISAKMEEGVLMVSLPEKAPEKEKYKIVKIE